MMTAMLSVRNIEAGARIYDIWAVNEDAEYHEAGEEGALRDMASGDAALGDAALSAGERAALSSVRDVPARVAEAGTGTANAASAGRGNRAA